MLDALGELRRTNSCSELGPIDVGSRVVLMGWVQRCRNLGNLIFVDLRDREGLTQIVFSLEDNSEVHAKAQILKNEFVIGVVGLVRVRPRGMINKDLPTGQIEILADELKIFSFSKPPVFTINDDVDAMDLLKLKYRYLDLRRPKLQKYIINRHRAAVSIRKFFNENCFIDIETPILTKSTPEGARDYLVPSRLNLGNFYALPQSPQLFKQLLMISGFDRYYQIVRCFRDEDLRADRQPEFTQIDMEMSFVGRDDIISISEMMIKKVFKDVLDVSFSSSFPRMTYKYAMDRYGSDKPDVRFDLQLIDVSSIVENFRLKLFSNVVKDGGTVKAINIRDGVSFSRNEIDGFTDIVKNYGAKGLVWIKIKGNDWKSPVAKFFTEKERRLLSDTLQIKSGDLVLFVADDFFIASSSLGHLRLHIANKLKLIDDSLYGFVWITDFPMFEYDKVEGGYRSVHHPFTSPLEEDLGDVFISPFGARSQAYDLILNGFEIGGGSVRIHDAELQRNIFEFLGMNKKSYEEKFGFLLRALEFGAPPHGGIAFGFDRLVMLMFRGTTIKDVMAFPKTLRGTCLLTDAPNEVDCKQLDELYLKLKNKEMLSDG